MTDFRADRGQPRRRPRRGVWAAAPVLVALLATPAGAQVGAPIQIGPPPVAPVTPPAGDPAESPAEDRGASALAPGAAPVPGSEVPPAETPVLAPAPSAGPAVDRADDPAAGGAVPGPAGLQRSTDDGAIQIEEVRRLTADAFGTLTPAIGGLPTGFWRETPGPVAVRLVSLLPAAPHSQTMRDLTRRLLLTTGPAPRGLPREGALLEARADRLLAMGAVDDLTQLSRGIPPGAVTPNLRRILADTAFSIGDDQTACRLFDEVIVTSDNPYWIKVGIVCDKRAGRDAKVDFGARLLGELGIDDPLFAALAQAAAVGQNGAAFRMVNAEPVHLALARVAGLDIDPDLGSIDSLPVLVALARGAGSPPFPTRLAAAEKAERAGALPPEAVTDLYDEVSVRVASVDGAIAIAEADPGPLGRAILWRAAQVQTVPVARAQAVARAMELANSAASWRQTARLFAPLLVTLTPGPELDWIASDVVRALIAARETRAVGPWIDRLRRLSLSRGGDANRVWLDLWPLLHLAGGDALAAFDEDAVAAWWSELRRLDPDEAPRQAAVALLLAKALGSPVGDVVWRDLVARPVLDAYEAPSPALRLALRTASDGARVGESVTLASAALGEAPLTNLDPAVVSDVIVTLGAVGLSGEARRLAVETALVHGL